MRACKCQLFTDEGSRRLPKRLNYCFSVLASATNRSISGIIIFLASLRNICTLVASIIMIMKVYNTVLICASQYATYYNVVCIHAYLHDHHEHLYTINSSALTIPDDHMYTLF